MNGDLKRLILLPLIFCGVVLSARVGVDVTLNREVYMQFEHIYACVTLRNDSGRPLLFGKDPALQGFLLFDIRDSGNRPVYARKESEISVTGLLLAPGEVRRLIFRLDSHYQLQNTGKFTVFAYISHNALKHEFRSKNTHFEISSGHTVWTRTVGLPQLDDKNVKEEHQERTYSLRTLIEKKHIGYYLVVESEKKVYGVCRVGSVVGYEKFQAEVDMLSRIHLLMPISSKVFHYLAFNYEGERLESSYWRVADTIPGLFRDSKNGSVRRTGGVRARPGIDFQLPSRQGQISYSEILNETEKSEKPARHSGVVDLGRGVMADAPGSRSREK